MSDEAYGQRERRRYLRRRVTNALLYGLVGAALGFGLTLYFRLHE